MAQGFGIMQAQDLDIRSPQTAFLDDGQNLAQRRAIAAGEDVFRDPGIGHAGPCGAADGVDQPDAVRRQRIAHRAEEGVVMPDADMFEHADRHDTIHLGPRGGGPVTIVDQFERHAVRQPGRLRSLARHRELFGAERDPGDARPPVPRQRDGKPAPAAADIQHRQARPVQTQLASDMAHLGGLRFLQRFTAGREIGAGIESFFVQKQRIQPSVQVIMMRDVAPGPRHRVVLLHAAQGLAQPPDRGLDRVPTARGDVADQQRHHIIDRTVPRPQLPVHIQLPEREGGVEQQPPLRLGGGEVERGHPARLAGGEFMGHAIGCAHRQMTDAHEAPKAGQQQSPDQSFAHDDPLMIEAGHHVTLY